MLSERRLILSISPDPHDLSRAPSLRRTRRSRRDARDRRRSPRRGANRRQRPGRAQDAGAARRGAGLREGAAEILAANARDLAEARAGADAPPFSTGSTLDAKRIEAMARGVEEIAALPDPVGRVLATFERPNGLRIERVATPLGVVGVIYESRPNVTADAGALCLKSGNAVVLRGGSDSFHSSAAIHACLVAGLGEAGLPEAAISRAPFAAREAVGEMLDGLDGALDVIVPRGGKSLVERVQREARVPVFAHLEGVVHVYVDAIGRSRQGADSSSSIPRCAAPASAAPPRRCWSIAPPRRRLLAPLLDALIAAGCAVRGDAEIARR